MNEIGAYEAKTHLSELLERVRRGERFTITKHGAPVAELVPAASCRRLDIHTAIAELRQLRAKHTLGDSGLREMIDAGRQ